MKVLHKDENSKKNIITTLVGYNGHYVETFIDGLCYHLELYDFKPYLRPMSSMTDEEKKEYKHLVAFSGNHYGAANFVDWLNAHHFDYRGLIEKNLALEAPKDMYK